MKQVSHEIVSHLNACPGRLLECQFLGIKVLNRLHVESVKVVFESLVLPNGTIEIRAAYGTDYVRRAPNL